MGKIDVVLISLAFIGGIGTGFYLGKHRYESLADKEVESVKKAFEKYYVEHDIAVTKKVTKELLRDDTTTMINMLKKDGMSNAKIASTLQISNKVVVKSLEISKKKDSPLDKDVLISKKDIHEYKDYSKQYQIPGINERIPGEPVGGIEKNLTEEERCNSNEPYVITPGEFNESTYEVQTLFFYADRVLADDDYNIVDDIAGTIGEEALANFGDGDCVYVRNDKLGIDYEVLIDERYFGKIAPKRVPGLKDDVE